MSGTPQQQSHPQPYGNQGQAQQWRPPIPKAPKGSMSTKAWGIILLILGVFGILMLALSVASVMGSGMSASTFSFNLSPEAKEELDRIGEAMVQAALGRWSFWLNIGFELAIAVVSIAAGFLLAIRPSPRGRKLAIARALIVLAALPVYGYENITAAEQSLGMMERMQEVQINDVEKQLEEDNPAESEEQREQRKRRIRNQMESIQGVTKGATYGLVLLTVVAVMVLNAVLLFFMTRPSAKEYLESVASEGPAEIPGYDPSMGMMGPPPQSPEPGPPPGQPPNTD